MICRAFNTVCQPMFHRSPQQSTLTDCAADVSAWCAAKRFHFNAEKTEVMWFGSSANLRKIPTGGGRLYVGSTIVEPVPFVRDLGVMIDSELSMRDHVSRTAQVCFYHLRRLRSVRRSQLGRDVVSRRLFSALIHPVAIGLLQRYRSRSSGLNIGTVLSSISGHATYVTPALRELHWLPLLISHEN